MMETNNKSLGRRLEELNAWLEDNRPGCRVRANKSGLLESYDLVAPDGIVHYRRDSFDVMERIAKH